MTLHEARAQYALGLITAHEYSQSLKEAIKITAAQKEIIELFWMIFDWENDLKNKELDIKAKITAINCHFEACMEFRKNENVPAYLQKMVMPLAKNRPLPENFERLYPRS